MPYVASGPLRTASRRARSGSWCSCPDLAELDAHIAPREASGALALVVGLDPLAVLAVVVVMVNIPLTLLVFEGNGVIRSDFHGWYLRDTRILNPRRMV
jgi:hypothetical protein